MASWTDFPEEIRLMILETLIQDGSSIASLAAVSREWQAFIEKRNFARIKLTPSCLADFGSIIRRNQHLVRYIWLCVELEHYSSLDAFASSSYHPSKSESLSYKDLARVVKAIRDLLHTLARWKPSGELLLDISIHSPSDPSYLLKYLTFEPDIDENDCMSPGSAKLGDRAGFNWALWSTMGKAGKPIRKTFNMIHAVGPVADIETSKAWEQQLWGKLPSVPAVTGVLLRQQTRRQWFPTTLQKILACFPRLQEVFYEPWRRVWRKSRHAYPEEADEGKFLSPIFNYLI